MLVCGVCGVLVRGMPACVPACPRETGVWMCFGCEVRGVMRGAWVWARDWIQWAEGTGRESTGMMGICGPDGGRRAGAAVAYRGCLLLKEQRQGSRACGWQVVAVLGWFRLGGLSG